MQMQMLTERLAPGVQHQGGGNGPAQPARVGAELNERCRDRFKQQGVDHTGVTLGERVQFMRQREHQMEVWHRQQFSAPGGKPALLGQGPALRAVAVAAGVVVKAQLLTGIAALDMPAESLGTAGFNLRFPAACRGDGFWR